MAKRFLPLKAETKFDEFYAILMSGDGIRKDNGAHDYYDIIPRERISVTNGTVGFGDYKHTSFADDVLKDVIKHLKKEGYIVHAKPSSDVYTGKNKAVTYYLAGE